MFSFRRDSSSPSLPGGYILVANSPPSPDALNRLLSRCQEETYAAKKLALAIDKSVCYFSIIQESNGKLAGFVRATSDYGLNANLWNLVAEPGEYQAVLLAVLVHEVMLKLKRQMPGCSVSIAAPQAAKQALQNQGFLLDPGGIQAMGIRLP